MLSMKATGSDAMSETLDATRTFWLHSVTLHLSAVGGAVEDFVVAVDSGAGVAYDVVILAQGMETVADLVWIPDQPLKIARGDVVDFTWANSNAKTWGLDVAYDAGR